MSKPQKIAATIVRVDMVPTGSEVTVAASVGDTVLTLDSAAMFTTTGGNAFVNGVAAEYDAATLTTVTLTNPLTDSVEIGDTVSVSGIRGEVRQLRAFCSPELPDDDEDLISARISAPLLGKVDTGDGMAGLAVILELIKSEWVLVEFVGGGGSQVRTDAILPEHEGEDDWVVTTLGDQTFELSHVPFKAPDHKSLHLRWGAISLPRSAYVVDSRTVTVTDQGFHIGDVITAQYFYALDAPSPGDSDVVTADEPPVTPPPPPGEPSTWRGDATYANAFDTQIDMPSASEPVQAGDLLVLAVFGAAVPDADPRISLHTTVGYGGSARIYTGVADASGDPLIINMGTGNDIAMLGAFSPATLGVGSLFEVSSSAVGPWGLQTLSGVHHAIGVNFASYTVVPGDISNDADGDWSTIGHASAGPAIYMGIWDDLASAASSPPGSFSYSGALFSYATFTAEIVGS